MLSPFSEWTVQQFRERFSYDRPYCYLLLNRDSIFSAGLDSELIIGDRDRNTMHHFHEQGLVPGTTRGRRSWVA